MASVTTEDLALRYSRVEQRDTSEDGLASLAAVARQNGLGVELSKLRSAWEMIGEGNNMLALKIVAEQLGFSAYGVKADYEDIIGSIPLPAIAHFRSSEEAGHFVVLHHVEIAGVVVADPTPGRGVEWRSREWFSGHWTGYLLLIEV